MIPKMIMFTSTDSVKSQALQPIIVQLSGVVNNLNVNFVCTLIFAKTNS